MPIRLVRPAVAAERWGISRSTFWRLTKREDFPKAFAVTASARGFSEAELDAWMERQQRQQPVADGPRVATVDAASRKAASR